MTRRKENLAKTIANAIVEFAERVSGPVTLAQIEREIPGFAEQDDATRSWSYLTGDQEENLIWDGMTEEGCAALRSVLVGRRVAIQMTPPPIYWLEGRYPVCQNWVPISLLPARMANLETPRLLIRGSQDVLDQAMVRAAAEGVSGFRLLHPAS
jgi:hypothetical protein